MKISLNWLFDHIDKHIDTIEITSLIDRFIKTTAEIDEWKKIICNPQEFTLAQVSSISSDSVVLYSPEWSQEYTIKQLRSDCIIGSWYLIIHKNNSPEWARILSLGGTKDTFLPEVFVEESQRSGSWKNHVEWTDYCIEIDNKSINHRPDLWGHRGIAREIAALLNVSLYPLEHFIAHTDYKNHTTTALQGESETLSAKIEDHSICKRFSALSIDNITMQPSSLAMIFRLSRLDARSINYIVDCTNYVMFDLGHPMHAFDADRLQYREFSIRYAHPHETLLLLDKETVQLSSKDIVISERDRAISLAGVMGGDDTGVTKHTTNIIIEAAQFNPTLIRKTSARHKKRTEASMRFEKNLDPHNTIDTLLRFLYLLDQAKITYKPSKKCIDIGHQEELTSITVKHDLLEKKLGVPLSSEQIHHILEKLLYTIVIKHSNEETMYIITPPSFRLKDIRIPEDIVEEIGRYIGYDTIPTVLPALQKQPADLHKVYRIRSIKNLLTHGLSMREIYDYSFFDESFLRTIHWNPTHYVAIKNPISEQYTRLVTTLQTHMLKAILDNHVHHKQLRFYEWGRVWLSHNATNFSEQKSLTGIFFEESLDFYAGKSMVMKIYDELRCPIEWKPLQSHEYPWFSPYQAAELFHNNSKIGIAGMLNQNTINTLSSIGGTSFIFELNGDFLQNYRAPKPYFSPASKYPSVKRDISIFAPATLTAAAIINCIQNTDSRIKTVDLIDFFSQPEWKDQKAFTFHIDISDPEKTLEQADVDILWNTILTRLQTLGVSIR